MTPKGDINYSIADQQMETAVNAVLIAPGAERLHGYALISGTVDDPEFQLFTFKTYAEMARALSDAFDGKLLSSKYHTIYKFGPDKPPRLLYMTIERDDDEEEAAYQRALFERESNA